MTPPEPDATAEDLGVGTRFGRHSIVRRIGVGGMATVYEAEHLDLQKRVAIKVMRTAYASEPRLVQRFVLEARAASRLRHPNVIAVYDVGVERQVPFIVMDLLQGEDLFQKLHRDGPIPVDRLADLMLPVISAVAAAHAEGMVHRDLKPENVFLERDRWHRERPVLLDFGISKAASGAPVALTKVGETVGTPRYMSPEQLRGGKDLDGRSDQYALGVMLYECATQVHPFKAANLAALAVAVTKGGAPPPSAHRPELPAAFDTLVLRAMSVSRDERFVSVRDLGRALWPLASPIGQVLWAEEFGEPDEVATLLSGQAKRAVTIPPPEASAPPSPLAAADLRVFTAFDACSDAELEELIAETRAMRFADGQQIVSQGAHGNGCFLLVSGEVQIVKTTAAGRWNVGTQRPGSVFGQIALVDHLPRTASVVAVGDVTVVRIGRSVFERLLADTSPLALRLQEQIAVSGIRQLRHATQRFAALLDRRKSPRSGSEPLRDLVFVQVAAREWGLPIPEDAD